MKKKIKILILIISAIVILLFGVGIFAGNYLYNFALNPEAERTEFHEADINQTNNSVVREVEPEETDEEWFDKIGYGERTIIADFDGIHLFAYQIEQKKPTDKWVILSHGYAGNALQNLRSARYFYEMGYNVLMPDARGHGKSDGKYIGMGWHDRLDLVQWIDDIIKVDDTSQIVLYGVSMGGATVMMTSGEDLPDNVKAIVEDCGYASVQDEFSHQITGVFDIPAFPALDFASLVTKARAGYSFKEASAVKQVAKSKTPILFIHGTNDTFVPYEMVYELYEAANVEKDVLVVEGAGHAGASNVLGAEYWEEVDQFISQYVKQD